jgi:hypothetical protein
MDRDVVDSSVVAVVVPAAENPRKTVVLPGGACSDPVAWSSADVVLSLLVSPSDCVRPPKKRRIVLAYCLLFTVVVVVVPINQSIHAHSLLSRQCVPDQTHAHVFLRPGMYGRIVRVTSPGDIGLSRFLNRNEYIYIYTMPRSLQYIVRAM